MSEVVGYLRKFVFYSGDEYYFEAEKQADRFIKLNNDNGWVMLFSSTPRELLERFIAKDFKMSKLRKEYKEPPTKEQLLREEFLSSPDRLRIVSQYLRMNNLDETQISDSDTVERILKEYDGMSLDGRQRFFEDYETWKRHLARHMVTDPLAPEVIKMIRCLCCLHEELSDEDVIIHGMDAYGTEIFSDNGFDELCEEFKNWELWTAPTVQEKNGDCEFPDRVLSAYKQAYYLQIGRYPDDATMIRQLTERLMNVHGGNLAALEEDMLRQLEKERHKHHVEEALPFS